MKRDGILTILILLGLLAGAVVGEIIHVNADNPTQAAQGWMDFGKLILVRPLMLMVLPLVFLSVIVGTTSIGDPSRLGVIGGSTLLYYFATMLMAVILGAVLVTTIAPGEGSPQNLWRRCKRMVSRRTLRQQTSQQPWTRRAKKA